MALRRLALQRHVHFLAVHRAQTVQRIAQRIYDAAQQLVVHADGSDAARAAHHHALLDKVGRAHEHRAHIVGLQVHDHRHDTVAAVQQFAGLGMVQAIDAHHAVTHLQGFADFLKLEVVFHIPELSEQDVAHFAGSERDCH